jgi:hypothetical protein
MVMMMTDSALAMMIRGIEFIDVIGMNGGALKVYLSDIIEILQR